MKACTSCGEAKPLSEFERSRQTYRSYCKKCRRIRAKNYTHKEKTAFDFWKRVSVGDAGSCWEWLGAGNSGGYGSFLWRGRVAVTSRIAAEVCGLILSAHTDAGRNSARTRYDYVLHKCDNRKCCNPGHLFLGTLGDNMADAYAKQRKVQPKGQHHANAKTTDAAAKEIRDLYATGGHSQQGIADIFGVSRCVVSCIIRGETYKCV